MNKSSITKLSLPVLCLSAISLYLTGNIIFSLGTATGFISALVSAIVFAFSVNIPENTASDIIKLLLSFGFLSVIVKVYLDFVVEKMLVLSFSPVIPLGFIIPTVYLGLSSAEVIKKGAFLAATTVSVSALFIFILSLPQLRTEAVFTVKEFSISDFLKSFVFFFSVSVFLIFISRLGGKADFKSILYVVIKVIITALLFCLLCVLLFGSTLSGKFRFPYYSAADTVNFGRLFSRIDEFAFLIYFLVSLFLASASIKNIGDFFEKHFKKKRTLPIMFTGVLEYFIYIILKFFNI